MKCRVTWLRPEDARFRRGRIAIRRVSQDLGESHARQVYQAARFARLGVGFETICRVDDKTFARVIRPVDKSASERGLFSEAPKFSVPHDPTPAAFTALWMWPILASEPLWPPVDPDVEL